MSWARDDQNRAQCTYFYKLGAQGPKYSSCHFAGRTLHMFAHVSTWNKVANGAICLHACCCLDSTSFISVLGTEVAFTGFLVNPNPIHTHTGFPHNFWFSYTLTFQVTRSTRRLAKRYSSIGPLRQELDSFRPRIFVTKC